MGSRRLLMALTLRMTSRAVFPVQTLRMRCREVPPDLTLRMTSQVVSPVLTLERRRQRDFPVPVLEAGRTEGLFPVQTGRGKRQIFWLSQPLLLRLSPGPLSGNMVLMRSGRGGWKSLPGRSPVSVCLCRRKKALGSFCRKRRIRRSLLKNRRLAI